MSAAGRALSKALDQPNDWMIGQYTATHLPSKTEWLHCNGAFFFDGREQNTGSLGLLERHWLYRKFNRMRSEKTAAALTAPRGES